MFIMINRITRHILAASDKNIPWQVPDFAEKLNITATVPEPVTRHKFTRTGQVVPIPGKQWPSNVDPFDRLVAALIKKNVIMVKDMR